MLLNIIHTSTSEPHTLRACFFEKKWWPFDFDAILTIQFEKKKKISSFSTC